MGPKNKGGSPFDALKDLKKKLATEEADAAEKARIAKAKANALAESKEAARLRARALGAGRAAENAKLEVLSEEELFTQAMSGVKPIDQPPEPPRKPSPKVETATKIIDEDLQELIDVVEGRIALDYTTSDEFVEGRALDCSFLQLDKLKKGDFSVEGHIDLHGLNREEAKIAVAEFLQKSQLKGHRCVLIVSGRGLRSPGGVPVIKQSLVRWLAEGKLSKKVLAFSSAQAHDGGLGALYVLLRRAGTS